MIRAIRSWLGSIGGALELAFQHKKLLPAIPPHAVRLKLVKPALPELTGREFDHTQREWGNNLEVLRRLSFDAHRLSVMGFHPDIDCRVLRSGRSVDFKPGDVLLLPGDLRVPAWPGRVPSGASEAFVASMQLAYDTPLRFRVIEFERPRSASGRVNPPDQWFGIIQLEVNNVD